MQMNAKTFHVLDRARLAVTAALAGVEYDALYRALECREPNRVIWQLETYLRPRIARAQVEAAGFDVTDVQDEAPDGPVYVRFAWPYAPDTDWPAAPHCSRPKVTFLPWERIPHTLRCDAVAGPGGVVLCDLETTPPALVPVPGLEVFPQVRAVRGDTFHYQKGK